MFCLNDGSCPEIPVEQRTAAVIDFLERFFPFAAPWETRADGATATPDRAVGADRRRLDGDGQR